MQNFDPKNLFGWMERLPYAMRLAICLFLILIITYVDDLTGKEASLFLFYIFPVGLATWTVGWWAGTALGAVIAVWTNFIHQLYSQQTIAYWNCGVDLAVFTLIALLLGRIRGTLEREIVLTKTDHLTQTLNRQGLYEAMDREENRRQHKNTPYTLAVIDLDDFADLNHTLGHRAGDEVLAKVAETLKVHIRESDEVARLGGDEFGVLLVNIDGTGAKEFWNRVHQNLNKAMEYNNWKITFSCGLVSVGEDVPESQDLFRQASQLVAQAKKSGKNIALYENFNPSLMLARGSKRP